VQLLHRLGDCFAPRYSRVEPHVALRLHPSDEYRYRGHQRPVVRMAAAASPKPPPKSVEATHRGILPIGGLQLECYVLEDGRRVFAKRGMARAIGLKSEGGNAFLKTLSGNRLGSEISDDLRKNLENPIVFNISGADPGHGYEAETLVDVCKAVIRADDAGRLLDSQKPMAAQARAIVNALAKVGIAALIDEATGYKTQRSPDALRLLVQAYIEKEQREWEKEFPDDFYLTLNKVYGSDPPNSPPERRVGSRKTLGTKRRKRASADADESPNLLSNRADDRDPAEEHARQDGTCQAKACNPTQVVQNGIGGGHIGYVIHSWGQFNFWLAWLFHVEPGPYQRITHGMRLARYIGPIEMPSSFTPDRSALATRP
jgi:hypothetical protein